MKLDGDTIHALSRREFIGRLGVAVPFVVALRVDASLVQPEAARLAVITDLHHGLAPDALQRFQAFAKEVSLRRGLHGIVQLGDFCYSDAGSAECLEVWRALPEPRFSVLGNHDMDKCDKATAMRAWGMDSRYWSRVIGGYRFVALDLNHIKKDGALIPYANGNYFAAGVTHNWADVEQLTWLERELARSREPVIILSHQPLGMGEPGKPLPTEQQEIFDVIARASATNPRGRVAACLSGHLHVDRLENVDGIPCLCLNSASYFWHGGMQMYTQPLFAFLEFSKDGALIVEGRSGAFVAPPPAASDSVAGRSASIANRRQLLRR